MKKILSLRGLTALLLLAAASAYAEPNAITITIVATFDVPGKGISTTPFSINRRGDIAGYYSDTAVSYYRGFIRRANGTIISPIIEPSDTGNYTATFGINSSQTMVGEFLRTPPSMASFSLTASTLSTTWISMGSRPAFLGSMMPGILMAPSATPCSLARASSISVAT